MADFNPFASLTDAVQSGLGDIGSAIGDGVSSAASGIGNIFGGGAPAPQAQGAQPQYPGLGTPPGYQRPAAESGSIMGFLDSIRGVPTAQQIGYEQQQYNARQETAKQAGSSQSLLALNNFATTHPTLAPHQVLSEWMKTPEGIDAFTKGQITPKLATDFVTQISPPGPTTYKPGDVVGTTTTDMAGNSNFKPTFSVPENLTAPEKELKYSKTEVINAGDPRATELGFNLKPGQSMSVKTYQEPGQPEKVIDAKNIGPSTVVNVEGRSKELEMGAAIKKREEISTSNENAVKAASLGDKIIKAVAQPDAKTGLVGSLSRVGYGVLSQAQQLASAAAAKEGTAAVSLDPKSYSQYLAPITDFLKRTGVASEKVNSNIVALAYMLALANNGGRGGLSNRDVAQALDQIGANAFSSPDQLVAAVTESIKNGVDAADIQYDMNKSMYGPDSSIKPPARASDQLRSMGLSRFTRDPSEAVKTPEGKPQFGTMSPGALEEWKASGKWKNLDEQGKAEFLTALRRLSAGATTNGK